MVAAMNPAQANPSFVDTRGLGKPPPLTNTEIDFVSWARRTENFVASAHPGARDVLTWAVERESATVTEAHAATEVAMPLDTANAGRSAVYSADGPRGRRIVRHPCGLWIRRRVGSLAASTQSLGSFDDGKSKRIAERNLFLLDVPSLGI